MGDLDFVDHLVYATRDLEASACEVGTLLGVEAVPGGQHQGLGTANWLIGLGPKTYLEIIGPDPDQPDPKHPRHFGIDELEVPGLVTWAVTVEGIEGVHARAKAQGHDTGPVRNMSRKTPDGRLLEWQLATKPMTARVGPVPFLIDWGATPSPATALPKGARLVGLDIFNPDPSRVEAALIAIGTPYDIAKGEGRMVAFIETENGLVTLT